MAELTLGPDAPTVRLHNVLHDGQAKAGAAGLAGAGFVDPVEALEDAAQVLLRHALAEVLDAELDDVVDPLCAHHDAAA